MVTDIPTPKCTHGMKAYVDTETGTLDDFHLFCVRCGGVVCLNFRDPYKKTGWCRKCNVLMSETTKKLEDGIGRIQWAELDQQNRPFNGGTI
jgi:hypothetical protein